MTATAKMLRTSDCMTVWSVKVDEKAYLATTYPDSTSVYLQKADTRRPISELQARRVLPLIRQAIEGAR